jgi:hypothetical protein
MSRSTRARHPTDAINRLLVLLAVLVVECGGGLALTPTTLHTVAAELMAAGVVAVDAGRQGSVFRLAASAAAEAQHLDRVWRTAGL